MITEVEKIVAEMLVENTGIAICDSGGIYGRNWQRNKHKTATDFKAEPEVSLEYEDDIVDYYVISVFHYLTRQLDLDRLCREFNEINLAADNWNGDTYGVSEEGQECLDKHNVKLQTTFNSYNGESALSQVIHGTYCRRKNRGYVLLQIHGGCDVRGGYTDARLFVICDEYGDGEFDWLSPEDVYGTFTPNGADLETPALIEGIDIDITSIGIIRFSNCYSGYSLTQEDTNEAVVLDRSKGKIKIWLGV